MGFECQPFKFRTNYVSLNLSERVLYNFIHFYPFSCFLWNISNKGLSLRVTLLFSKNTFQLSCLNVSSITFSNIIFSFTFEKQYWIDWKQYGGYFLRDVSTLIVVKIKHTLLTLHFYKYFLLEMVSQEILILRMNWRRRN